ncbi:RNA-directed DNA polymerase [Bacillus cereus]|nr:RNA-directed DNA polymerase [Bacillus cereus]MEC3173685.1 RNA-directed DNA polymerase [Bacillus cereus]
MKSIKHSKKIRSGKRVFYLPDDEQSHAYQMIKNELIQKYNIQTNSRDEIIKSLISQLTHGDYIYHTIPTINLFIFRTDIKNFFPSIKKHKLYQKLNNSNVLSTKSLQILKEALFSKRTCGIPLGLQFSSHLAEFYLEQFDLEIQENFKPLSYFRYVDDILIIQYDFSQNKHEQTEFKKNFLDKIDTLFSKHHLQRNKGKTEFAFYNQENLKSEMEFNYLGYNFKTAKSQLKINISPDKEAKIIKKINCYVYDYKKGTQSSQEFWKLYYKLKNTIYGVCSHDKRRKLFKFGLGYNYRYVNEDASIEKIIKKMKLSIYSCKLSSYKRNTLLSIIDCEKPKDILAKRYNYLKLSPAQQELIQKRLNMPTVVKHTDFSSKMFFYLYS